jgi:hypothetical protein
MTIESWTRSRAGLPMPAVAELYQDMSRGVLVFFTRRVCDERSPSI